MPVATVARPTEHCDLKSLPGAYVVIRRMNYGEKLEKNDEMFAGVSMKSFQQDAGIDLSKLSLKKMTLRDFGALVIEHNLTDENETPLDFTNAKDVAALDPRVGEEINSLIEKFNSFEESTEVKN